MEEGKTNMFGKTYNTIGSTDSNFIIKTKGDLKVQWGGKFIDIIKNGKIAQESTKILNVTDNIDKVTKDGIYLIEDSVWAVINGTKIQLNSDTQTFISYLTKQELTPEQKNTALVNVGFYYNTLEEAKVASGIIFVKETNKLYIVHDGQLLEYSTQVPNTEEVLKQPLYIEDRSIFLDGIEYIRCDSTKIEVLKPLIANEIQSDGASDQTGYRLYMSNGISILEVDKVISRTSPDITVQIYPTKYFQQEMLITRAYNAEGNTYLQVSKLESDTITTDDILLTYIIQDNVIPVIFTILEVEQNVLQVTSSVDVDPTIFQNKQLYYVAGNRSLLRIQKSNLDLLSPKNIEEEPITTRIGDINELFIEIEDKRISDFSNKTQGIYTDNAVITNSSLIKTKQYNTKFHNLDGTYPEYDTNLSIPSEVLSTLYDQSVPNLKWIKEIAKLLIPPGTIVMWSGSSIPEGWTICDGNNGTPNLVGKFIKAVSAVDQIGDNESELNENNEFTITQEYLPKHSHPHKSHTHDLTGNLSGTTGSSGDLTVSLDYSDYNWGIRSVQKTFVTSVTGEGVTSETGTVDGISSINTQGGSATGGSHTHSISLDVEGGISLSSITSEEETLKDSEWPNKPLKIEPRSYSLVFIMKL